MLKRLRILLSSKMNIYIIELAGSIGSLVNPQLDDFRRVMFNPALYSLWEILMVETGLQNNQLFPGLVLSLVAVILSILANTLVGQVGCDEELSISSSMSESTSTTASSIISSFAELLFAMVPLSIALWGASLFKSGNSGAGFAQSVTEKPRRSSNE